MGECECECECGWPCRYVIQETDEHGNPYFMYMADNWVHGGPNGLIDASYVWLPMQFEPNSVIIKPLVSWDTRDPFANMSRV